MLCEIECRALSAAHPMLMQDFEPRDALTYLEGPKIFTEDHSEAINKMSTRQERIACFLRFYRRHASELHPLIGFFNYNSQNHIAEFLEEYIYFAVNEPEKLRPVMLSPLFSRQMLDRKLLLGNVPKQMSCYSREYHVDLVIEKLEAMCELDSFFLFLHGRAGSGKSVIASQALSRSDQLIGIDYDSVVWLKDSGTTPQSTFHLFADLLLMLKSEEDLLNFPSVEHVTSVVLKKMIANALIDRPNTLFVLDDVVQEETIRWAQELRLRCLITTRDVELTNAVSPTCEFIEVTPFDIDQCCYMLEAYGMPMPAGEREEDVLHKSIELISGNPAALMMIFKSCEPKTFEKMAQLNNKLETRGLSGIECITPYCFKSLAIPLQRCVEVLSDEDRSALAFAVIMPPGIDIPVKIWSCVIPVDICSNEEDQLDDEVADRLKRLSKRGAFLSGKRSPVLTYKIDNVIHLFLKHVVDAQTIASGISTLEQRLQELGNNNIPTPERHLPSHLQKFRRASTGDIFSKVEDTVIRPEDYPKFMQIHRQFYDSLKKFISL